VVLVSTEECAPQYISATAGLASIGHIRPSTKLHGRVTLDRTGARYAGLHPGQNSASIRSVPVMIQLVTPVDEDRR